MLNNYYLLRRLAHIWDESFVGASFVDAWSHTPGELVIALEHNSLVTALSFLTHAPLIAAFRRKDVGRPRRNVTSLFRSLRQQSVTRVSISESDRILTLWFTGDLQLHASLYGSRANVVLADTAGQVQEVFRRRLSGQLPKPRIAPEPRTMEEFMEKWDDAKGDSVKTLQRIFLRFSRDQAMEAMKLQGQSGDVAPAMVFRTAQKLHMRLLDAEGPLHVYRDPLLISLIPMSIRSGDEVEVYDNIDVGVRKYAQHALSAQAYRAQYEPQRKQLVRLLDKAERSLERMKIEKAQPSRANEYEQLGHLLMASPVFPAGESRVELSDVFNPDANVTVKLNPARNSIQNAERYYSKARKARTSRKNLDLRIEQAESKILSLQTELDALEKVSTIKELKALQSTHAKSAQSGRQFRRYILAPSYELWVGRSAQENEILTFQCARSFDLWFHARGVVGAHAILRLPGRDAKPSSFLIEQAAAITAWHSKARTSSLAPVVVTPRKYVYRASGAPLGNVVLTREEVVMVEPSLP